VPGQRRGTVSPSVAPRRSFCEVALAGVGRKRGVPAGTCKICALRATDPLRLEALENRLALGESRVAVAKEFGIDRHRVLRTGNTTAIKKRSCGGCIAAIAI
jgi:DNA invertase Pin-like site-specific DNA recombinase